ncbi:MAG: PaaI family thioesterase [Pseudomonadota bacterium]
MRRNLTKPENLHPWSRAIGLRTTRIERGKIWGELPYDERLIGDLETGGVHGGIIFTFLDNLSGKSCTATMKEYRAVATLDLRIDHMRPAERNQTILGKAECYRVAKSVAFTRAWAYHETQDRLIAVAQGAFAITKLRTDIPT